MRILHVHNHADFKGGIEQILFDTARGLSARGWPQALLRSTPDAGEKFVKPFENHSNCPSIVDEFRPDAIFVHKVSDPDRVAALARIRPTVCMVHDHDLVCPRRHKYFPIGNAVCNKPAGLACYTHLCCVQKNTDGFRIPLTIRGTGEVRKGLMAAREVNHFLVGSSYMKKELEINGIKDSRISVVHPVPAALCKPSYQDMNNAPEVLFVGQVIRGKGVDLLLRALARINGNWRARIVGDGNHLEACKDLAQKLGIGHAVDFTGWVEHEQLNRFYASARMLVVPSRWPEPFGMVGIEAMSRGRPVVAFGTGGIPDWLADGRTGLIVPPADVEAMSNSIKQLLNNANLAQAMGRNAVEHVSRNFSHRAYLDRVMHHLEQNT